MLLSRRVNPGLLCALGVLAVHLASPGFGQTLLDTLPVYSQADYPQVTPALATGPGSVLATWEDGRSGQADIYACRVADRVACEPAGFPVCLTAGTQRAPAAAFDGGNWLVVWHDYRNGSDPDIYAARVDSSGIVLDPLGIAVSTAPGDQRYPRVAFNGQDFVVVWHDYRNGDSADIYAARVDRSGNVLDPQGIPVSVRTGNQWYPDIATDGTTCLVTWQDRRNGSNYDIYAARLERSGSVPDPNGIPVSGAGSSQQRPRAAFDGMNYFIVWQDRRNGDSTDIYGARVSPLGSLLDPDGVAISLARRNQSVPAPAFDGSNFLVAWQDFRDDDSGDIFAARVTSGGATLDPEGIPVAQAGAGPRAGPAVVAPGAGGSFCVWQDGRGQDMPRSYGAGISSTGQVLIPDGSPLLASTNEQTLPAIDGSGADFLAVWQDARPDSGIRAIRLGPDGTPRDPAAFPIAATGNQQTAPALASLNGEYLVVWQDRQPSDWDIWAARVTTGGTVLDTYGFPVCRAAGDQKTPRVATDGLRWFVVWTDTRGGTSAQVFGARVGADGTVLDPGGRAVAAGAWDHSAPALAVNHGCYLVTWGDWRSGRYYNIFGARLDTSGVLLDTAGIAIAAGDHYQERPAVAACAENWLVVWNDERVGNNEVCGARVSPAGEVLDPFGFPIGAGSFSQHPPALAFRAGRNVVAWERDGDIAGAEVRPSGSIADTFDLVVQPDVQLAPGLASDSVGCALVYAGWTGTVLRRQYNTLRIWSAALPVSSIRAPEPLAPRTPEPIFFGPNPARDWLRVGGHGSGNRDLQSVSHKDLPLRDVSGREVCRLSDGLNDIRSLAPGVYFLDVRGHDSESTRLPVGQERFGSSPGLKLVIQR